MNFNPDSIVRLNQRAPAPGSVLFLYFLVAFKVIYLSGARYGTRDQLLSFSLAELFLPTAVLAGFYFSARLSTRLPYYLLRIILSLSLWYYFLDLVVILGFDYRIFPRAIPEILKWALRNTEVIVSFISLTGVLGALALLSSEFVSATLRRSWKLTLLILLSVICTTTALFTQNTLQKYRFVYWTNRVVAKSESIATAFYSSTEIESYRSAIDRTIPILHDKNIIVVIIESLSPVDVHLIGGMNNYYPKLEQLAQGGAVFTNFFANYFSTEGGIIAMFGGFPPLPYPGSSGYFSRDYGGNFTVLSQYTSAGFQTEFLTTGPLSFLQKKTLLENLGFQKAAGNEEVAAFQKGAVHVFKAPPDHVLYNEAIERIKKLKSPYLLALETVSSHYPYRDPLKRSNDTRTVLSYVDSSLFDFHTELERSGFYKNGILLVVGDHRKMIRTTEPEIQAYGESAESRVVLVARGAGIPGGATVENWLQQSDLFKTLASGIVEQTAQQIEQQDDFSPYPIFVERYELPLGNPASRGKFKVFYRHNPRDAFQGIANGNTIRWIKAPDKAEAMLATKRMIHGTRSTLQHEMQTVNILTRYSCLGALIDQQDAPTNAWIRRVYRNSVLKDPLGVDSESLLATDSFASLNAALGRKSFVSRSPTVQNESVMTQQILHAAVPMTPGTYRFRFSKKTWGCVFVDDQLILDSTQASSEPFAEGRVELTQGNHRIELRLLGMGEPELKLLTRRVSEAEWHALD